MASRLRLAILAFSLIAVCIEGRPRSTQEAAACTVSQPTASFTIRRSTAPGELSTDPRAPMWSEARAATIARDCSRTVDYPDLSTEVRGFWTDTDLYLLFVCPYRSLNVFLPVAKDTPRHGLWDRDVVEMFLGDDWTNIRHYREFEIAPTGDWIDLAIDLDRPNTNREWRSRWTTAARIDERARIWYAACRIPLTSISEKKVVRGTRWRANLYRIDGEGPDARRRFMCWQPTCAIGRDPNHVPEHFGTLIFDE
jgi:hypothetical protein